MCWKVVGGLSISATPDPHFLVGATVKQWHGHLSTYIYIEMYFKIICGLTVGAALSTYAEYILLAGLCHN